MRTPYGAHARALPSDRQCNDDPCRRTEMAFGGVSYVRATKTSRERAGAHNRPSKQRSSGYAPTGQQLRLLRVSWTSWWLRNDSQNAVPHAQNILHQSWIWHRCHVAQFHDALRARVVIGMGADTRDKPPPRGNIGACIRIPREHGRCSPCRQEAGRSYVQSSPAGAGFGRRPSCPRRSSCCR